MAILNLDEIKSPKELERIARRDLEGKKLGKIAIWAKKGDAVPSVSIKDYAGHVIEKGYFRIERNNDKAPDISGLGIEIKTSPLKLGKDGKLRVKEPLSLNIINYVEEVKNKNLTDSSFFKKNHKTLFVWYVYDKSKPRSEYVIKYVFLWEMDKRVIAELSPDYEAILRKIREGRAHHIHQSDHRYLTLCPKHGGTFRDPNEMSSKRRQPFSDAPAEVRAFRLKNSYMNMVILRYLQKERPNKASEFVKSKSE